MRLALLMVTVGILLACSSTEQAATTIETETTSMTEPQSVAPEMLAMTEDGDNAETTSAPRQTAPPLVAAAPVPYFGQTSLEERIASHQIVVKGTLDNTTSEVVAAAGKWQGQYAIAIKFHLTVSEYLKGSGADNVVAVWGSSSPYPTEQEAEAARPTIVSGRPTTWDDQEAVFFLHDETFGLFSALEADNVFFIGYGRDFDHDDGFSLNSRFNRVWLPAVPDSEGSGASGASGGDQEFMLGTPIPPPPEGAGGLTEVVGPTVTLQRIKDLVTIINAEVAAGDGSHEYEYCVVAKYQFIREEAYSQLHGVGPLYAPNPLEARSGRAASTPIFSAVGSFNPPSRKTKFTIDGDDANMFTIKEAAPRKVIDGLSVFDFEIRANRPIPRGTYNFHAHYTHYSVLPCAEHPQLSYEVEYTAENNNAIHEAYFDPVTVGSAVAADSSNGVLKPTTFTDTNGASATVQRIEWEAPSTGSGQVGTVKVTVSPPTGFAGQTVDFIELDAAVSLSLKVADATVDAAKNTLSWSVTPQPWHDGDKLMVRIREGLPYVPVPQGVTVSLADGEFTISWSAVTGAAEYRAQYRTGSSEAEWTNLDATTDTSQTFSPEGGVACGTTYEFRVQARGNSTAYLAEWSAASESASLTNRVGKCNRPPVFDSATYAFTVAEDAPVWPAVHVVGTVLATDPDVGDSLLYYITAGNGAGRFNISSSHDGAQILVWGALDYETTSSYTLTVEARDGKEGGTSSTTVEISVTDVAE